MKTLYFLCFNSFYFACKYFFFLENVGKKRLQSGGGGVELERVGRVTVNTTLCVFALNELCGTKTETDRFYIK